MPTAEVCIKGWSIKRAAKNGSTQKESFIRIVVALLAIFNYY